MPAGTALQLHMALGQLCMGVTLHSGLLICEGLISRCGTYTGGRGRPQALADESLNGSLHAPLRKSMKCRTTLATYLVSDL